MAQQPNTIEAEANRWAIRLDAGPLSAAEQAEFESWVTSDPRRQGALVRARAAWLDADRVAALAARTNTMPAAYPAPSAWRRWLIAASIATFAVVLAALWYVRASGTETFASEIGEVRKIELSDGSELTLNTNTQTAIRFGDKERAIALERGEALFKVAHDVSRPFVVRANGVQVKAVGTAFTVRVDDARVDVLVTEGVVEVVRERGANIQRIAANHRAMIASSASRLDIEPIDSQAMTRRLAWREGMVAFAGEPLGMAVAEINRHSRRSIHIDDPALAAQPVVGIFHASDAEAFANAAAATFGAEIVHADDAIHLRSASP